MAATIKLKSRKPKNNWISSYDFEILLSENKDKIFKGRKSITFSIPAKACLPLQTIVRLLNVSNQYSALGFKVKLKFLGKESNAMSYCDRMGVFGLLQENVLVEPEPPERSRRSIFQNNNGSLVELEIVNAKTLNKKLPQKLADTIINHLGDIDGVNKKRLANIYRTIFSELTNNIYEHSKTKLDGYVAMQLYKKGLRPRAELIICDSGLGLLETIKPSLKMHNKKYKDYLDAELVAEMLTVGISSKDPAVGGGNGIETCFRHASKMNSDLTIRLNEQQYRLFKVSEHDNLIDALVPSLNLLPLKGTFICFEIPLIY
jgi:hypothetical protein